MKCSTVLRPALQKKTSFIIFWYYQNKNKVLQNRPETNISMLITKRRKTRLLQPSAMETNSHTHRQPAVLQVVCARCISSLRGPFLGAIARWFVNQITGVSLVCHVTIQLLWDPFFGVKTCVELTLFCYPFFGPKSLFFWLGVPNRHASSLALNFSTTRSLASRIK